MIVGQTEGEHLSTHTNGHAVGGIVPPSQPRRGLCVAGDERHLIVAVGQFCGQHEITIHIAYATTDTDAVHAPRWRHGGKLPVAVEAERVPDAVGVKADATVHECCPDAPRHAALSQLRVILKHEGPFKQSLAALQGGLRSIDRIAVGYHFLIIVVADKDITRLGF